MSSGFALGSAEPVIRILKTSEWDDRLDELSAILVDAVASGASVNFMAGFTLGEARVYWQTQQPGVESGEKVLFVAEQGGRLIGTVLLLAMPQPNQWHRAEIGKMIVLSQHRRQGLGARLLEAAEQAAKAAGRTLLMLDTETGSAGERLYRRCGWVPFGIVPGHSHRPNGELADTTFFFKQIV